ncbi:MAG: ABC transporter substrate-binding protein, partial [Clostridiales bacterium]
GDATTKIVTDYQGRQVEIPTKVTKVAGFATAFLADLGHSEMICAPQGPKLPSIYEYTAPAYAAMGNDNAALYADLDTFEVIAKLDPDIYFCRQRSVGEMEQGLADLGIPMIVFHHETPEEYYAALRLLGDCIGDTESAERVIKIYQDRLDFLFGLTKDAPKPTAVIMGGDYGQVANGSMLQSIMMDVAGITNAAQEIDSGDDIWPNVGIEKIFEWDPEYIFITTWGNATYTIDDILKDPAWSELKAVKNGHIYPLPATFDKWEYPYACAPLLASWMTHIAHPDLYSEQDMVDGVLKYYVDIYGDSCKTLTRELLGF